MKKLFAYVLIIALCLTMVAPAASATGGYDENGWSDAGHTHNYSGAQVRVEPDCLNEGYVGTSCTGCSAVQREQILPALGHSYVNGRCIRCSFAQPNYCPGDLNGDRQVTNDDVVLLMWAVLFPAIFPLDDAVDYTGDGRLTNGDVIALMWYVLFPDVYPI